MSHRLLNEVPLEFQALLDEHYRLADAWELVNRFTTLFWLADAFKSEVAKVKKPKAEALARDADKNLKAIGHLLAECKIDHGAVIAKLTKLVKQRSISRPALKSLSEPLRERQLVIRSEASKLPPSLAKAAAFLRSCVNHDAEAIDAFGPIVDQFDSNHPTVESLLAEIRRGELLSPQLGAESYHSSAWAIFLEYFGANEAKAKSYLAEIEDDFRRLLNEETSNSREWFRDLLPYDAAIPARLLWLISRSRFLTRALRADCEKLVDALAPWQDSDGAWRHKAKDRPVDDTIEGTALCLLALARFQNSAKHRETIRRAANWLCHNQRSDGGWNSSENSGDAGGDLIATAVARLALATSVHEELTPHIERADTFLMSKQEPLGNWEQRPWWSTFVTAIILESLTANFSSIPDDLDNQYLRAARELLPHGHRLVKSGDPRDWRLGVIALYHGLEALLYGCFLNFDPTIPIWQQKNAGQTIGLREALSAFRERQSPNSVPYDQQIRTIAALRDGIVHKSDDVTKADAEDTLKHVSKFLMKNANALLHPSIAIIAIWPDIPGR